MRIIAGRWRSRKIDWPAGGKTRPITDRVREALFDVLGSRYRAPGALPTLNVADVFCGGGSLGLEALSRGASRVCFFDHDRLARKTLQRNLDALQAGSDAVIVGADIWRRGANAPPRHRPLELIFIDPPFADSRELSARSKVGTLLRRLASRSLTADDALVVFRHEARVRVPAILGAHWLVEQRHQYGVSGIAFLVRREPVDDGTSLDEGEEENDGLV